MKILILILFSFITLNAQSGGESTHTASDLIILYGDDATIPDTITGFTVTGSPLAATLNWTESDNTTGVIIFRGYSANPTTAIDTILGGVSTYLDTPVVADTNHYRVLPYNDVGFADTSYNASDLVDPANFNAITDLWTEADAITGWQSNHADTLISQSDIVQEGTYAVTITGDGVGRSGAAIYLPDEFGLSDGDSLTISFFVRHNGVTIGTGDFEVGLTNDLNATTFGTDEIAVMTVDSTSFTHRYSRSFTLNTGVDDWLKAIEGTVNNDGGVIIDDIKIDIIE